MFGKKENSRPDFEIFTIYDSKTKIYERPHFALTKDDIIREALNVQLDPKESMNKLVINAEDYSIFKIGTYDKSTGMLTSQNPEHVVNMHDLRAMARSKLEPRALDAT